MSKFRIGDRVIVYNANSFNTPERATLWGPFSGEVVRVDEIWGTQHGFISVMAPWGVEIKAHPKQCRRIKPKPMKRESNKMSEELKRDIAAANEFLSQYCIAPGSPHWLAGSRDFLAGCAHVRSEMLAIRDELSHQVQHE